MDYINELKNVCTGANGFVSRNRKMGHSIEELAGTVGLQIRTHDNIKCKIYFGYGVPDILVEKIFTILPNIPDLKSLELINIPFIPKKIGNIRGLKILGIESKFIDTLPIEISHIKTLTELSLRLEKMYEFPNWILQIKTLEVLDLFGAGVKEIPYEIDQLVNLKVLDLCGTHLEQIPPTILNLNLPFINFFNEMKNAGIYFCDATCTKPPLNIIYGGRERLELYFKENHHVSQSEVRVILLGWQGSGKTSVVERIKELEDGQHYYSKEKSWTEGISISDIPCDNQGILHVWDFGGQEIMLSTHTLFLRDHCIYVIVLNARQGDEPDHWLDYVNQYGKNSTVFIVNNHIDERGPSELDFTKLKRIYSDLIKPEQKIWEISCDKPDEFPLNDFYKQLCKDAKEYFKHEIPAAWNNLSLQLSDMKKRGKKVNYITHEDYLEACEQCSITDDKEKVEVLKWLNDIGIVFTYGNSEAIDSMNEFKVLRPAWVTDAIYKIINNTKSQNDNHRCLLSHDEIRLALKTGKAENNTENRYSELEIGFVLDVMRKFGLSFRSSDTTEFIPAVADSNELEEVKYWIENEEDTILDMTYSLISKNNSEVRESSINLTQLYQIIIKLVAEYNEFPNMWRRGALFSNLSELKVLILLDNGGKWNNELRLIIKGDIQYKQKAAQIQWKIFRHMEEFSKEYKLNAKMLLKNGVKKHYFPVENAMKSVLNQEKISYIPEFDMKIDLYKEIISKVIPYIDYWNMETSKEIYEEVKNGQLDSENAYNTILQEISKLDQKIVDTREQLITKISQQDVEKIQQYMQEIYHSPEIQEWYQNLSEDGKIQKTEIQKIQDSLQTLLQEQNNQNGIKTKLTQGFNYIVSSVSLATADYGKIMKLMQLISNIVNEHF